MTISYFIILVTFLSSVASLLTEALKKTFIGDDNTIVLVAIVSALVGWAGGAIAYVLLGVAFTLSNIICLFLLAPTIWLIATLGYDKVMEVITKLKG